MEKTATHDVFYSVFLINCSQFSRYFLMKSLNFLFYLGVLLILFSKNYKRNPEIDPNSNLPV